MASREGRNKYQRDWRKANPLKAKNSDLKKSFGIGLKEYEAMLRDQKGGCAICGGKDDFFRLSVDHCHDRGYVRGLLCGQCNIGLGAFKDSPERMRLAAEYIERSNKLI